MVIGELSLRVCAGPRSVKYNLPEDWLYQHFECTNRLHMYVVGLVYLVIFDYVWMGYQAWRFRVRQALRRDNRPPKCCSAVLMITRMVAF